MTDHTQNHDVRQRALGSGPALRIVSDRDESGHGSEAGGQKDTALPRWAVFLLVIFYCAAVWALAFWIISALF